MGRHRKQSPATVKRGSVLALTGLVPTGFVACAAASDLNSGHTAVQEVAEEGGLLGALGAAEVTDDGYVEHAMAAQGVAAKPVVKTVALPTDRAKAELPAGPGGIPGVAVAAYQNAEQLLAAQNPVCNMEWTLLAGIGRVESTHVFGGKADAEGNPLDPVYGPVLDGSLAGNAVIHDSDGGALDGLGGYDRAVGPMQFLPETWTRYAADGNGDGIADPQNLYDAALTAGKYLCDGNLDMRDLSQRSRAILRYNNSMAYVANVMAWANSYGTGVAPKPAELPRI
ncbi:lytic murein transglycosylase [Nocardia puris]|uniref:Membrane-bound lytic murein transglycosylase B n=1 Tax=Nocardia puris TaxID=208602 RepID=A0A366DRB8_9NOCA|nr:lytic murein transglycosylase [Nocardia puris]MBF6364471.1 lytic murein transglycosylase [Nocardia puris]MBF6459400.1 lytic murein transglycosylase [Nocardia puris]RBO92640.1 membrane-bound lytic murein transglycosylase B [Nocardia puris]